MTANHVKPSVNGQPTVLTIGHSTRTLADFVRLLHAHGVTCVMDVRTVRRSRHNAQFNGDRLAKSLKAAGIGYLAMEGLGGLRHARGDSPNTGWRNRSFRAFADYMQTLEFERSLAELITIAKYERIALMSAEAVPWRCHLSLIADALLVRGIVPEHIMSGTRRQIHSLTPFAQVRGVGIVYPAAGLLPVKRKPATARVAREAISRSDSVRRDEALESPHRKPISSKRNRTCHCRDRGEMASATGKVAKK